ncbi:MAG: pyrimidine reductase family protein [Frankiales bacterium]|nr:pyrimidine reductase family protein [Frankiales bacterium]
MRSLFPRAAAEVDLAEAYAAPPGRHLRVNFAASADGAVTVDGRSRGLSSDADREVFHLLRDMCDVVLVGAGTARTENYGGARTGPRGTPPIAVVSRSLRFDPSSRLFTDRSVQPIVVTCAAAPSDRREALTGLADVVVAGDDDVDLAAALEILAERGLVHVLCEGGPHLFGTLLAAGLVDELCLTVAPLLAGGAAGRIVDGLAAQLVTPLELGQVLVDDGHLFLRYSTARG